MSPQKRKRKLSKPGEALTEDEAKHILKSEGGVITFRELLIQIFWAALLSGSLAWAIYAGQATVWHLTLPLIAEYLACLVTVVVMNLFISNKDLGKESLACLRLLVILIVGGIVALYVSSIFHKTNFMDEINVRLDQAWSFVFDKQAHWAILVASLHSIRGVARNVFFLVKEGPPFLGPGMGCAMRIAILVLSVVIVPAFALLVLGILKDLGIRNIPHPKEWLSAVWLFWGLYTVAEFTTIWFLWDIQKKFKIKELIDK
jgi:hypothetical protein